MWSVEILVFHYWPQMNQNGGLGVCYVLLLVRNLNDTVVIIYLEDLLN